MERNGFILVWLYQPYCVLITNAWSALLLSAGLLERAPGRGIGFDLAKACGSLLEINCDLVSIVTKRLSRYRGCLGAEWICFIVGTTFSPWVSPLQLLNNFHGALSFWPLFLPPILDLDYGREVSALFFSAGNKKSFLCKIKYVPSCSGQFRLLHFLGIELEKNLILCWFYLCLPCLRYFFCLFFP